VLLVTTLLHDDAAVRTAAASLAFNVAAYLQKGRVDNVKSGGSETEGMEEDGDWEIEMASAVVEAIDREKNSEEVGQSSFYSLPQIFWSYLCSMFLQCTVSQPVWHSFSGCRLSMTSSLCLC
jgi:hypothetical protein